VRHSKNRSDEELGGNLGDDDHHGQGRKLLENSRYSPRWTSPAAASLWHALNRAALPLARPLPCRRARSQHDGVMAGTVRVSLPSAKHREVILADLTAGELFGEIALLDGKPRSADVTALTTVSFWCWSVVTSFRCLRATPRSV